jgi:hypothetical protein
MNISSKHNPIVGIIAIVQTILVFLMGILGNKISETFEVAPYTLLFYTGIGMVILAVLSYVSSSNMIPFQSGSSASTAVFKRFLPKTMIGMFPFGIMFGLIVGAMAPNWADVLPVFFVPKWLANVFNYNILILRSYEFFGVVIGTLTCVLFAITVNTHLGSALAFGFGVAFPAAILMIRPIEHEPFITFIGHILWFAMIGIIVILAEPGFRRLRKFVTEQRL